MGQMVLSRASPIVALLFLLSCSPVLADGPTHRALLIGNNYPSMPENAGRLQNAVSDAEGMENLLVNKLGVSQSHVIVRRNADRATIQDTWEKVIENLVEGVGIFYFSGHGIEVGGKNYLIPDGAMFPKSNKERELQETLVSFNLILRAFLDQQEKHSKIIGIFILDACRGDPFPQSTKSFGSIARGLAPVQLPQNSETFVMYAAGAGQLALDAVQVEAGKNSVFTRYLLAELPDKKRADSLSIADLAQNIREKVVELASRANHAQVPSYYDQLVTRRTFLGARLERLSFDEEKSRLPDVPVAAVAMRPTVATSEPTPLPLDCKGCPSLVVIPAGRLGNAEIRALAFGKTEVTNREWNTCVKNGGCEGYRGFSYLGSVLGQYRENRPATDVTWNDAKAYVDWLSGVTKQKYRLPTEVEWEYAARSGSTGSYSFGDKVEDLCQYANGADQSLKAIALETAPCKDGYARETAPVATFRANTFGLHDMHGNVWEWVDGCWVDGGKGAPTGDPGKRCDRIARGGSWRSAPKYLQASSRTRFPQGHARSTLGFRVVRELIP
jgi:hypothetical protein